MTTVFVTKQNGELLASGTVLFPAGESIFIKIVDEAEELTFEVKADLQELGVPPQLGFNAVTSTFAQLIFKGGGGPIGVLYKIPVGTLGQAKLTVEIRLAALGKSNELTYSFWGEPLNG